MDLIIFVRSSLYKVLSEVVLIKQFTLDLYYLTSCMPTSTNRFTQKCHCFQSDSDNFFYLLSIL